MFPKLWEAAGRPFSSVVADLIDLAIARHRARAARRLSFTPPTSNPGRDPSLVGTGTRRR
jgi:hypothetical protein